MQFKYFITLLFPLAATFAARGQNLPDLSATAPAGPVTSLIRPPFLTTYYQQPSWVRTYVSKIAITDTALINASSNPAEVQIATAFKDGFNRTMQTVQHNFTTTSKPHLIQIADTRFKQDEAGYLPYVSGSSAFDPNMSLKQETYVANLNAVEDLTGASLSKNISNAGMRAVKTMSPGASQVGQNRGVTIKQTTNATDEVKMWELDGNGLPVSNTAYPAGMLFGQQVYDTMGALVTTYTDRDGNVVCKTVKQGSVSGPEGVALVYGTTQYIYNDMGRLFTVPPEASNASGSTISTTVLNNLCFQYRYDSKGRLSGQRFPGEQGFTEVVYDNKQRSVMRRSPNEAYDGKWEVTYYDLQGRVKATSLLSNNSSRDYWQGIMDAGTGSSSTADLSYYLLTVAGEAAYPAENAISGNTMMSYSYYDNYSLIDPNDNVWNSCNNILAFSQLSTLPGAETPVRSKRTYGMLTGSRVRILPSAHADPAKTGQWRNSVVWYDDKGRVINSAGQDFYGSTAIHANYAASRYDFAGKVLASKQAVYNANSTDPVNIRMELYWNEYNAVTGRLTKTSHRIGDGGWQVLGIYEYDELGRAKRNVLGNYGEVQDMKYNIRGQLTGINAVYAETGNKQGESRSFGESLKYDYGFSSKRYDGKIAGMIWRGSNTANMYAYGYSYDYGGRLLQADFRRKPGALAWENTNMDYTVSNLKYDRNGNIKNMKQKGMGLVGGNTVPVLMDDLDYQYNSQSNQLLKVQDPQADYHLGDFVNTNGSSNDYTYDPNGNLKLDNNKGILNVDYTYFNKPQLVSFLGDKQIEYSYDAAGNKVQELIIDPTATPATKRTDYIGNNVYEGDKIQYLLTPNGRSTFDANGLPKEEFFVKDHLGNVRSVVDVFTYLTQEYMASYEIASANIENMFFENVDEVRDDRPGATWNGDLMSARLNGADPERRVGTSALLKVMAGDKVEMTVNNYYENYDAGQDEPVEGDEMIAGIIHTMTNGGGGMIMGENHDVNLLDDAFKSANTAVFNNIVSGNTDPSKPKAYLNYILFDEYMQIVPAGSGSYQANGDGTWTQIGTVTPMEIPVNGYLAVYLTNASKGLSCLACNDVFFDQLLLRFTKGMLKEETHYYPHGLPMAGMGSAAAGFKQNKRKYQGNEYNKDLGLNWMNFQARQYDPQLGKFLGVDPLAANSGQDKYSPYAAMGNAPESMVDPNGTDFTLSGAAAQSAFAALQHDFGAGFFVDGEFNSFSDLSSIISNAMSRKIGGCSVTKEFVTKQSQNFFGKMIGSISSVEPGAVVNDLTEDGDGDKTLGYTEKDGKKIYDMPSTGYLKLDKVTYNLRSFESFYKANANKYTATSINGIDIEGVKDFTVNGKSVTKLYAEAGANLVLKNGAIAAGEPATTNGYNSFYPSVLSKSEIGRTGRVIHTHPFGTSISVKKGFGNIPFTASEGPSTDDYKTHSDYQSNIIRSVMVDASYIYLFNRNPAETIIIAK